MKKTGAKVQRHRGTKGNEKDRGKGTKAQRKMKKTGAKAQRHRGK